VATAIVLGTVTLTLVVVGFALLRLRRALDGAEYSLRLIVTALRIANRAAGRLPATAARIGSDAVAGQARLDRLEDLKARPARRASLGRGRHRGHISQSLDSERFRQ